MENTPSLDTSFPYDPTNSEMQMNNIRNKEWHAHILGSVEIFNVMEKSWVSLIISKNVYYNLFMIRSRCNA